MKESEMDDCKENESNFAGQSDSFKRSGLYVAPFDHTIDGENCGTEWKNWLRSFEFCMEASNIEDPETKRKMLMHFAGRKVQEIFINLPEVSSDACSGPWANEYVPMQTSYEKTTTKLNDYFLPKQHTSLEHLLFNSLKQKESESINSFVMRLQIQSNHCDFGEKRDMMIKDRLIQGCRSSEMRRELLKLGNTTYEDIFKTAKIVEFVLKQEKAFAEDKQTNKIVEEVHKIENKTNMTWPKKHATIDRRMRSCTRCGYEGHDSNYEKCPAMGKKCNKCNGLNHFSRKCRSRKRTNTTITKTNEKKDSPTKTLKDEPQNKRKTEEIVKYVDDNKNVNEYIFCITTTNEENEFPCELGGVTIKAVIDSGSKFNLLDKETWNLLKSKQITVQNQRKTTDKIFKAYGGHTLQIHGVFEAQIKIGLKRTSADFYVINGPGKMLIGRDTANILGVLKIGYSVDKIQEESQQPTNQRIGTIKDVIVTIPIKENAKPVVQSYRRVPVPLEDAGDKKLDDLLKQGIIEKVNWPSKWVSPMVVIPKEKDVRICIDMRRANEAVERENHPLPTMEDFLPHIRRSRYFSLYDIRNAFHQVEISPESREITTFITRKGLFRYTRLMFGISCAPEIFQKIMEQILSNCDGCVNFIDDILVYGATKEEHDSRALKVRETLHEYGVELNHEKCIHNVEEIKFLGHKLSVKGVTPTEDKLDAIRCFREPATVEETRSFLGLVNYIGKFLPNLSTITDPLRRLTEKGTFFKWEKQQQDAFDELKHMMTDKLLLGYYDVNDQTQVIADASPVGLGAILIQVNNQNEPRVISYASKSLSNVEKRYAQTEKEALALVWAVERFHFYLYGRCFDLITDHKPLEVIFGPRSKPCLRIERWVLRLQAYKYKIIYRPGKTNIADPLSRLVVDTQPQRTFDEEAEHYVNSIASVAAPVAIKLCEIEKHSQTDKTTQLIKEAIYNNNWDETNDSLNAYKAFTTEFCFAGEILLRSNRIVMPQGLRHRVLELAHEGHPGMSVMKRRIRAKIWWPKIDRDVEEMVKRCHGCMLVSAPPPPEPIKRKELPNAPWQHLALDFLGPLPSEHYLLVIVDYHSRFIEIEIMKKIDSCETIKRLNRIFARFGLPLTLTVDNGRQLVSEQFRSFCDTNNIKLITTTPYWPQMNGEVERQNRSILKRLTISQNTNRNWMEDLNEYLLMYRSTQHSTTSKTPSELMFGRNIRDKLPQILHPLEVDDELYDRDKEKKESEKRYADKRRHAKLNDIKIGDEVLVKTMTKANKLSPNFNPAVHKVVERKGAEAIIESKDSEKLYRRNVTHLKKLSTSQPEEATKQTTNEETSTTRISQQNESTTLDQPPELPTKRTRKIPGRYLD